MKPRYIVMITPSRWLNGGKGLDKFREDMLSDQHIRQLVDYQNAKDCFPGSNISGGVNYFLWERDNIGDCLITNIMSGRTTAQERALNQFPVFVRYNEAVNTINKVRSFREESIVSLISSRNPFGVSTSVRGGKQKMNNALKLFSSGETGYIGQSTVTQGNEYIDKYKAMISRFTSEHAGEPGRDGTYRVISTIRLLNPQEVCTDSYLIAGASDSKEYVENFISYICTKFVRFLILQSLSSINLSRERYSFVPIQNFSKPWTDAELYEKYGLSEEEIAFVEAMIRPME